MHLPTGHLTQRLRLHLGLGVVLAASLSACTSTTKDSEVGAGRKQFLIVSQESVVNQAQAYYAQERSEAAKKGTLVRSGREYERLRVILNKVLPATVLMRPDAANWAWELTLINEPETVNAHVMAGGKVTFYTGFVKQTSATDDELAAVMGHEIAHALREHTREKMSQSSALGVVRNVGLSILGASAATQQAAQAAQQLALDLPFSRAMESEADALGLELSARAGYNPRGAVTLWEKMAKLSKGGPAFLSTHPASQDRRDALEALLPKVMPLYQQASKSPLKPFNVGASAAVAASNVSVTTVAAKAPAKNTQRAKGRVSCEPQVVRKDGAVTITFADVPHPGDIAIQGPEVRRGEGRTYRFISLSGIKDNGLTRLKSSKTLVLRANGPLPLFGDAEPATGSIPSLAFYKAGSYRILVSTNLETDDGTPPYGSCDVTYSP